MQSKPSRTFEYSSCGVRREGVSLPRLRRRDEQPRTLARKIERMLQRKWKRFFACVALLLLIGQAPTFASTINVNPRCTLARAIDAANTDNTAAGFCAPGFGPDRIVLPPNSLHVLTQIDNAFFGPTGLPIIRTTITIVGSGSTIIRAPRAARFRIVAVGSTGRLTLSRLTIKGGIAPRLGGGGIRSLGSIALIDTVLDGNRSFGSGGGLWAQNIVTIIRSKFSRNRSECPPPPTPGVCNGGGGIYTPGQVIPGQAVPSSFKVESSEFEANTAGKNGGGLQVNGMANINDSVLADNSAQQGGAMAVGIVALARFLGAGSVTQQSLRLNIAAQPASVMVTNTTLTDNRASVSGGGIAISNGSDLTLINAVVSGNSAPQAPEAIAQGDAIVVTNANNEFGTSGEPGVVGIPVGVTDTVLEVAPPDPIEDLPPLPLEPEPLPERQPLPEPQPEPLPESQPEPEPQPEP